MDDGPVIEQQVVVNRQAGEPVQVIIIGDSTASIYGESAYPGTRWGQLLNAFFGIIYNPIAHPSLP